MDVVKDQVKDERLGNADNEDDAGVVGVPVSGFFCRKNVKTPTLSRGSLRMKGEDE